MIGTGLYVSTRFCPNNLPTGLDAPMGGTVRPFQSVTGVKGRGDSDDDLNHTGSSFFLGPSDTVGLPSGYRRRYPSL